MKRLILVMVCAGLFLSAPAWASDPFAREFDRVEKGNRQYGRQHFDRALELYEQAEQEVVREPRVHFNRGAALFKLGRPQEAREAYLRASGIEDPGMKKRNYYNIGNTFLAEEAFHDAIPYYRRALEIDPGFDDARFNLELALQAIRQQQQQQQDGKPDQQDRQEGQDQNKEDQQKDQEKAGSDKDGEDEQEKEDRQQGDQQQQQKQKQEQEQQDQNQQDQEGREDEKEQPGQQDQPGDQEEQEQREAQPPGQPRPEKIPGQLSKAEFRDLLDSMRDGEKPFQMHKFELPEYRQRQTEKDW
jgi:tetratricopeptide (TPR) repeat protein